MSIDAVVGRIDQILSMEQQLSNPSGAQSATGAASSYALPSATGTGTGSTSFSNALASAQASLGAGASSQTGLGASTSLQATLAAGVASGGSGLGATTGDDPRIVAMVDEANSLLGKPYVFGGGHAGWGQSSGYDCSGFVSAVLHAGGYLSQPADTTTLPDQPGMEPGPGNYVTIYDRAQAGETGHVIIEINGQFYESGGSTGPWGGGGGVERIGRPSAAYLSQFPNVLHPSGL